MVSKKFIFSVVLFLTLNYLPTFSNALSLKRSTKKAMADTKVIIIGGGVSGLAAASKLISNGIKNVVILEANNRLGGRVNTITYQNRKIEMGAQWIHGQGTNPVYQIMKSLNQIDPVQTFPDETFYYGTPNGTSLKENFVENILDKLDTSYENLETTISKAKPSPTVSVGSFLDKDFNTILKSLPNPDMNLVRAIYTGKLNDEKVDYATDSFYDLSAQGFNEFEDFPGEEFTNLKNGYIKLIEYLSQNIPSSSIKYNEEVKNIDYSNPNGPIKISAFNKIENALKSYTADIVLTTSSLGYLKSNHLSLFTPNLPSAKISAIQRIGYGTVDKIFLVFDSPVFKNGEVGLQIFWNDDMPFLDSKYNLKGNKFYKDLNSFYLVPNNPNVLFGFLVGSAANYAENLSDSDMLSLTYDVLTTAFPKLKLPKPSQLIRSKWNNDPYAKGSYSYYKIGSTYDDFVALGKPVNNRLFFAGEATSPQYTSTVHGAYITGVNAATKITTAVKS